MPETTAALALRRRAAAVEKTSGGLDGRGGWARWGGKALGVFLVALFCSTWINVRWLLPVLTESLRAELLAESGLPAEQQEHRPPIQRIALLEPLRAERPAHLLSIQRTASVPVSPLQEIEDMPSSQCLGLGVGEGMDKLLSGRRPVFVLAAPKASGRSFGHFARRCVESQGLQPVLAKQLRKELRGLKAGTRTNHSHLPSVVSSHVIRSLDLVRLVTYAADEAVIVYVHREETSRFKSAVRHVVHKEKCCNTTEAEVMELVATGAGEIGRSGSHILACDVHRSIEEHAPNLVFLNYAQASKMIDLLATHLCPAVNVSNPKHTAAEKEDVWVKVNATGEDVTLDDWLDDKMEYLARTFVDAKAPCQAATRKMERDLFACPDATLQFSRAT